MAKKKSSKKYFKPAGPNSYMVFAYGAITVFVLFLVLFVGVRFLSNRKGVISDKAAQTKSMEEESSSKKQYTVVEGDTLWSISQEKLNDGFLWEKIANENKIVNPNFIEPGLRLVIPMVQNESNETIANIDKITGDTYTVKENDNLWEISVRAYADGFAWAKIARENNLLNPDIVYSGNTLKLPR